MGKGVVAVAAIAGAALAIVGTATGWSRQAALERSATALTGARPSIVCETSYEHAQGVRAGATEYLAFTRGTRLVVLSPATCKTLRARDLTSGDFAIAAWVLAHELGHVVGRSTDETAAECYAFARWRDLAGLLGLARPTASQEARVAFAHDRLPAAYRGRC